MFTHPSNRAAIEAAWAALGRPAIDVVEVPLPPPLGRVGMTGRFERVRYFLWLGMCRRAVARAHRLAPFDLGHHVSISCDWFPPAVGADGPPLVWGPLGGAPGFLPAAARWLGLRGTLSEVVRTGASGLGRSLWGRPAARRAAVVIVQNPRVAARLTGRRSRSGGLDAVVVEEPHMAIDVALDGVGLHDRSEATAVAGSHRAVAIARLLPWKGLAIVIAALATPAASTWRLDIYGRGHDERRLRRVAARYGVSDRVRFIGPRPRAEVLAALATADALAFPGLADPSAWVVAEARTLGVPVVCIDRGWPTVMVEPGAGEAVPLRWRGMAEAYGEALARCAARPRPAPSERWRTERLPALVQRCYDLV